MRQANHYCKSRGNEPFLESAIPNERDAKKCETHGQIIVQKSHFKCVAVSHHADGRRQYPWRSAACGGDEGERSPEERQNADGYDDLLRSVPTKGTAELVQQPVAEHVVPLRLHVEVVYIAFLNQIDEPRIIDMAAEIARFYPRMPEAGNKNKNGDDRDATPILPQKCCGGDRDRLA